MNTNLKHYGYGVYASNGFLADIARQCIEREIMLRQCLAADSRAEGNTFSAQGVADFTTYSISDND